MIMPALSSVMGWYCPRGMCLVLAQTKEVANEVTAEGCPLIVLLVAQRPVPLEGGSQQTPGQPQCLILTVTCLTYKMQEAYNQHINVKK